MIQRVGAKGVKLVLRCHVIQVRGGFQIDEGGFSAAWVKCTGWMFWRSTWKDIKDGPLWTNPIIWPTDWSTNDPHILPVYIAVFLAEVSGMSPRR